MPRVIGIDPGTISIDICGLDDGRVFLDETLDTREALADRARVIALLESRGPVDLICGPSGYGLPLRRAQDLTEEDIRLAYLTADGDVGGIGGLGRLARALAESELPVVFTPGVVHLPTVPTYRKVNRVDMGTADKVCATAFAVRDQARRRGCTLTDVSLILLELGGAFTAAVAVERGQIVDGLGGSSGPLGMRSAGALDGEVAFLLGTITKRTVFDGGAMSLVRADDDDTNWLESPSTPEAKTAWFAFMESAVKAVVAMLVSAPSAREVVVSGRVAAYARVRDDLTRRLQSAAPHVTVHWSRGLQASSKQGALGAALIADGLAGGREAELVQMLGITRASGTVLDHLTLITPAMARYRLGIA